MPEIEEHSFKGIKKILEENGMLARQPEEQLSKVGYPETQKGAKTLGETIVRTTFNPSDDSTVQHIKERAAEMINYVNDNVKESFCEPEKVREAFRLKAQAIEHLELAAMYAVKAATV